MTRIEHGGRVTGLTVQLPEIVGFLVTIAGWYQNDMTVVVGGGVLFMYGIVNKIYILVRSLHHSMAVTLGTVDTVIRVVRKIIEEIPTDETQDATP
jgi:hypothetical protein